jgi:nitroreductase
MSRTADHPIDPIFLARWSPRAMDATAITHDELARLFEASRGAPSASNLQPWRFVYAVRETPEFQRMFDLLTEGNRIWCARAGALIAVCSRVTDPQGQVSASHAFDTGAAWMALALQASQMGLVAHAMGGFHRAMAPSVLGLPPEHEVHCLVAVGHRGDPTQLPPHLRAREHPNGRNPIGAFVHRGRFGVLGLGPHLNEIHHDLRVAVDAQRAFEAFTREMGRWWPLADQSVAGADAVDCEIEPAVGGHVVERTREGIAHVWGTVWRWEAPAQVVFTWHPGHDPSVHTMVAVSFVPEGSEATRVTLVHYGWEMLGPNAHHHHERHVTGWLHALRLYHHWVERSK